MTVEDFCCFYEPFWVEFACLVGVRAFSANFKRQEGFRREYLGVDTQLYL